MDKFTLNSRPAAANYQQTSSKESYKYTVIVCNNINSVCQYCHIKIKRGHLMLMTKSQRNLNDEMKSPCYYGYHCDCFFLSANVCKNVAEIHGYGSLAKYHRHYIARKLSKTRQDLSSTNTKEMPIDLRVGYSIAILDSRFNYYCELCCMAIPQTDMKISGLLRKQNDLVVYHPRCFAQSFGKGKHPIKLQGFEKLNSYDFSMLTSMLNVNLPESSNINLSNLARNVTQKDAFLWPRSNSNDAKPTQAQHEQHSTSSSSSSTLWDSAHLTNPVRPSTLHPRPSHPSLHPNFGRGRSSEFDTLMKDYKTRDLSSKPHEHSPRKRRTSFKPTVDCSSRSSTESKKIQNPSHLPTSDPKAHLAGETDTTGKVELKKSTIRSEITKILYKYNHDYITSKIVRTMLMRKFGCDLTPHKKFIDDTIMELLDIIDNNPVNLKSIPGRVFVDDFRSRRNSAPALSPAAVPVPPVQRNVSYCDLEPLKSKPAPLKLKQGTLFKFVVDKKPKITTLMPYVIKPIPKEGDIDDIVPSPTSKPSSPIMSPMSANIDDISPFAIMGNHADEIALSNVDDTINKNSSKPAWGDKSISNSPTEKEKEKEGDMSRSYAISASDKPVSLCECCLCCFRIQSLEEIRSLYTHVRSKHSTENTCAVCNITYKDVYALMLHVAEFHRSSKALRCKNCRKHFNHHSDLSKHIDFCFLSSESDDLEGGSPVKSPQRKKAKYEQAGMPELVNTLMSTQDALDKIKTFITSETGDKPLG